MISDFDIDPILGRIVLRCRGISGETWLKIMESSGETIGEIPPKFLPHHPRWASDGLRLTFSGNDGRIGVHEVSQDNTKIVYEDPSMQAGFSQWSPDGLRLVFSAYGRQPDGRPPDIFHLTLADGRLERLTSSPDAVDRFPNWSPSGDRIAFHRQNLRELNKPKSVYLYDIGRREMSSLPSGTNSQRFGRYPWSRCGRWFSLQEVDQVGESVRVVDLTNRDSAWAWDNCSVLEGAFSALTNRLLCILPDELIWFRFPEGRVDARLKLPSGVNVSKNLTWHQIAIASDIVYFLATDNRVYRWDESGKCTAVAEHTDSMPSFKLEEFTVPASDGLQLPAQRLVPHSPREIAVLYVHGGPGGSLDRNDSWALWLVRKGFEVVRVAYRGSTGFGNDLQLANKGVCGVSDVQDVVDCGVYWKQQLGSGRRIALFGNSYGGFLSLLALANPSSPFLGAVSTCTCTSLRVMRLHHDRFLPANPTAREKALQERSVLWQAEKIKRPALLFHGGLDTVATTDEMRQVERRINDLGGDCSLVVFVNDTHGLEKHRDEVFERATQFFENCLPN